MLFFLIIYIQCNIPRFMLSYYDIDHITSRTHGVLFNYLPWLLACVNSFLGKSSFGISKISYFFLGLSVTLNTAFSSLNLFEPLCVVVPVFKAISFLVPPQLTHDVSVTKLQDGLSQTYQEKPTTVSYISIFCSFHPVLHGGDVTVCPARDRGTHRRRWRKLTCARRRKVRGGGTGEEWGDGAGG